MNKYIIPLLISCLFSLYSINAQSLASNYKVLRSEGEIPSDFKDFMQKNPTAADFNLFLKEMFLQGNILYGNPLNQYINTVADEILKDYPSLRKELRFYILKSPVVNASATENGIILINMGLLAQLSNESELAFIMAHEIVHYVEHHIYQLNTYEEALNQKDYKNYYLQYHNRSREHEMEADRIGFDRYYKNTAYNLEALNGVFDVLQYSQLPFDEIPLPRSYFETDFYQFPDDYFLTAVTPIRSREDYIDTLSTHPNIQKRRENILSLMEEVSDAGRKKFVQDESLFYDIRTQARFECINLFLIQHNYEEALYNAYILEQIYPDEVFLQLAKVASIYGIAKFKSYGHLSKAIHNYKNVEGEIQQVSYFFSKISKKEVLILALRFAWNAYQKYPENTYLENIVKDLMAEININNNMGYTDFSDYPMGSVLDSTIEETASNDTMVRTNKYERIKQQSANKVKPSAKFKTANYMLVDFRKDEDFMTLWNIAIKTYEDKEIHALVQNDSRIDVHKLLIVKPYYYLVHNKRRAKAKLKKYANSEKQSQRLSKTIQTSLKKLELQSYAYTVDNIKQFNTVDYNQHAKIQSWIQNYVSANGIDMIHYQSTSIQEIARETGCDAINFIVVSKSNADFFTKGKKYFLLPAILCPVTSPAMIARIALPRKEIDVNFIVVDIENGDIILNNRIMVEGTNVNVFVNQFLYNMYAKLKTNKK